MHTVFCRIEIFCSLSICLFVALMYAASPVEMKGRIGMIEIAFTLILVQLEQEC